MAAENEAIIFVLMALFLVKSLCEKKEFVIGG